MDSVDVVVWELRFRYWSVNDETDGRHNLRIIDMSGAEPTTHVRRIPFEQRDHRYCSLLSLRDGVAMSVGSPSNIYVMRF